MYRYTISVYEGKEYLDGVQYTKDKRQGRIDGYFYMNIPLKEDLHYSIFRKPCYQLLNNGDIIKKLLPLTYDEELLLVIRERCSKYSLTDKLFMEAQYDGTPEKLKEWKDAVKAVKEKYPKPAKEEI